VSLARLQVGAKFPKARNSVFVLRDFEVVNQGSSDGGASAT
jgi:hypothetical protein